MFLKDRRQKLKILFSIRKWFFLPLCPKGPWGIVISSVCLCVVLSVCPSVPQHNISSMYRWRKVICYLMMPLGVAKKPIEEEFVWLIFFGWKWGKYLDIYWMASIVSSELVRNACLLKIDLVTYYHITIYL